MNFNFSTANRILFGEGRSSEAPGLTRQFGTQVLLVSGSTPDRHSEFRKALDQEGLGVTLCSIQGEPTIQFCEEMGRMARNHGLQVVIGMGGGSVLDGAKAIAAFATNQLPALEYLEVIGAGHPLTVAPLPVLALPTTSGTGSEVTRNAVLTSNEHRVKVSLRSEWMLPKVAIIDPLLTHHLPPALSASTGMDALSQLIEAFISCKANPMTDGFCREGIPRLAGSIVQACQLGGGEARREMSLGSLLSGLALANSGLGAVHGFAAAIGGMFGAPHGMICASLLSTVFTANYLEATRMQKAPLIKKFGEVGAFLTGSKNAQGDDAVRWLQNLANTLEIPNLRKLGIRREELDSIIPPAKNSSSMKGNPLKLSDTQLSEILHAAW